MTDEIDKLASIAEEAGVNWRRDLLAAAEDWRDSEQLSPSSFGTIMDTLLARNSSFVRRLFQLSAAHLALRDGTDVNEYLIPRRQELRTLLARDVAQVVEEARGKL
jgi:hypothetical protein